jgi:hypothetical protein
VSEKAVTLWKRVFGEGRPPAHLEKVLIYVASRVQQGVPLDEVVRAEYVRRNASPRELERILDHPEIVGAARSGMRDALSSHELSPRGSSGPSRPGAPARRR